MKALLDLHGDPFAAADGSVRPTLATSPANAAAEQSCDAVPGLALGDVPRALRRRAGVALAAALVVGAIGAAGVHRKFKPSYRAESTLHVAPVMPRVLHEDAEWHKLSVEGFYNDYVRTLTQVVTERRVMADAVERLRRDGVEWRPAGVPENEAPDHLRARLQISVVRETHLLRVALDDGDASLPAPVVNAVTEAFVDQIHRDETLLDDSKAQTLLEDRDRIRSELDEVHAELDLLSEKLGSALLDERQNPFVERLHVLDEGMTKIFVQRVQAEGALENARGRAIELLGPVPAGLVEAEIEADVAVRDARVQIIRMLREMDAEIAGLSPEHPRRLVWDARRAGAEQELAALVTEVRARATERIGTRRAEEAAELVSAAERDVASARRSESSMVDVLDDAKRALAEHGRAMFDGSRLRDRAARLRDELRRAEARVEELRLEARAPARVTVRAPAVRPLRPARDVRVPLFGGVAFVALAAGAGLALLLDRRVPLLERDDDIESAGGETLARVPDGPLDSYAAADVVLRMEARCGGAPLRAILLPGGEGLESDVNALADTLAGASPSRSGLCVVLAGDVAASHDGPRRIGAVTQWGPVAPHDAASTVVRSPEFRAQLDALVAAADLALVAAPCPVRNASSWSFVRDHWRPVLVVRAGETRRADLVAAVRILRSIGAATPLVIVVDASA